MCWRAFEQRPSGNDPFENPAPDPFEMRALWRHLSMPEEIQALLRETIPDSIQPLAILPDPILNPAKVSTAWTIVVLGAFNLSNLSSASEYSANGAAFARISGSEDISAPTEQQAYTRGTKPNSTPVELSSNICRKYSRSIYMNCVYCHLKKSPIQSRMVGVCKALTPLLNGDETADETTGLGGSMRLLLNMLVGP